MTQHFLEGNALVKRYRKEEGSEVIENIFNDSSNEIYISNLTPIEMIKILEIHRKSHTISDLDVRLIMRAFSRDVENRMLMVPYYDEHIETAVNLISKHDVNELGAVQLAIALGIPADIVFVSTDRELIEAAKTEGLQILNPESE